MMSSFAARNRGSQNPHQSPVKSHKGGYLRCPFNISGTYAALAEKRVKEDLAKGSSTRGAAAVADKDGLLTSSAGGRGGEAGDGPEGGEGRPWSRAGVGAAKLSSKEKRTQQEQAELIYGSGSVADGKGEEAHGSGGGSGGGAPGHGASQEHMFAVDTREQTALQQVVPRAVREKVKRRRFEEHKQDRTQLGHHTPRFNHGKRAEGVETEEKRETLEVDPQASRSAGPTKGDAHSADQRSSLTPASTNAARSSPAAATSSLRDAPSTSSAPQRQASKPMNRMQMLDAMRASALAGKKRKR